VVNQHDTNLSEDITNVCHVIVPLQIAVMEKGKNAMNEKEMMREFTKRARQAGLDVACLGAGNLDSELVIIGEAPGEREALMKMPLVGGSGKLLWDILRTYNIQRTDAYVTNVVKRQVSLSTNTDARNPVKRQEIEHWEGLLDWELDHLPNVKYILCLGNIALHALTGDSGITNWRGSVFDCKIGYQNKRTVKVLSTNNPAMIMRDWSMEPIYRFDLKKLRKIIDGTYEPHTIKPIINPSCEQALDYIVKLNNEDKPISFDIEVIGNETACIGLANNAHEGICINFRNNRTNVFSLKEELEIRKACQLLFQVNDKLVAQNGNFDSYWLWYKDRIRVQSIWFDTLLAHHTLYPRMPHNLGFLTSQYTNHPYYKDEGKTWREGGGIDQFWEYNVKDVCITWAAHEKMMKELANQKLDKFFFDHVMRLQSHLVRMTVGGVKADVAMKERISDDLKVDLERKLQEFHENCREATGNPSIAVNPKSPKQLSRLFFDDLKLVGRGMSTNKLNRQRMKSHPRTTPEAIKIINTLDDYLTDHKFYSTYALMKVDIDGRIRCEYKQFGVQSAPGRLSSSQTMWGSGMNLQNQPQRAYPMFIADKDYMFSYFDLSQAEARVVAYQWQVQGLIENFEKAKEDESFDVHRGNAARIFKCDYNDIPAYDRDNKGQPTARFLGKRCVHGLNYRMLAPKLAEVCDIDIRQAEEAWNSYHRAFPEIQRAWKRIIKDVKEDRVLFSPLGRRLIFLNRVTEDDLDSVVAFIPQSTVGDKVSSCIYLCHDDPEWPKDARMALNIHDALIAIHRVEDMETVQRVMKRHAEAPITIRGHQVIIPAELKASVPDESGVHRWSTLQ
jgi:uracil-DNA glycosylase family 4